MLVETESTGSSLGGPLHWARPTRRQLLGWSIGYPSCGVRQAAPAAMIAGT